MGNRVKGRPKKSSIKAAISSNAGTKRKLSRMGKKRKKGHAGLDATFIGRSKCLKLLQVSIKDFRRLCILKGIYPRDPINNKVPGNKKGQTFYHIKDIKAIAHEPILDKFREFKAFMKKVRRAAGRNEKDEALRRNATLPTYSLHHLVKERYPRFVDALSDLDDALTLIYLFAALPNDRGVKVKYVNKAKTLAAAWGAYCATTSSIIKSFISVKGVYMEASIQSINIRWIIPHAFTQFLPDDVDFRVMNTFLEFYETLLNFVLYKLYNDIGIRYPFGVKELGGEVVGSTSAILHVNLRVLTNAFDNANDAITDAVTESVTEKETLSEKVEKKEKDTSEKKNKVGESDLIKSVGAALNKLKSEESDDEDNNDDDESIDVAAPLQAALENVANEEVRASVPGSGSGGGMKDEIDNDDAIKRKRLFHGLTFFLSREIPRGYLELVCLAYGAKVGWEGPESPITIKDPSITHHIVDRPRLPNSYETLPKSREYIQPQYILDCANFMFILPIAKYTVGTTLPPHLSPWVDDDEEGYKPKYAEEIERLKNGESIEDIEQETEENDDENTDKMEKEEIDTVEKEETKDEEDESESEQDEEEDEEESEKAKQRRERKRKQEEQETHELAKSMMNKKAAHLYGRMQHGIARKQAKVDVLHERRKELDKKKEKKERDGSGRLIIKGREKDDTGKTPLMQKVERLRGERKAIEAKYTDTGGTMKKKSNNKKKNVVKQS